MQFQVPQFIETEDKIIGPFTLRQFMYLAVAGAISAISFLVFTRFIAFIIAAVLMGLAAMLAFIKINGRNMTYFLSAAFRFMWKPQVYVFKIRTDDGAIKTQKTRALSASHNDESGLRNIGDKLATSKNAIPKRELALPPSAGAGKSNDAEIYEIIREKSGASRTARRVDYR